MLILVAVSRSAPSGGHGSKARYGAGEMAVYFFHCTDGFDLVLDRVGQNTRSRSEMRLKARRIAEGLAGKLSDSLDWSGWVVSVQNRKGRLIEVVPFPPRRR